MSEWISVKNHRRPTPTATPLLVSNGGKVTVAAMFIHPEGHRTWDGWPDVLYPNIRALLTGVTHWMPLPHPPSTTGDARNSPFGASARDAGLEEK